MTTMRVVGASIEDMFLQHHLYGAMCQVVAVGARLIMGHGLLAVTHSVMGMGGLSRDREVLCYSP